MMTLLPFLRRTSASLALATLSATLTAQATFTFSTARRGPVIGPLHYGIFFEEINHAGDGGLYAQLVRNGSMEENSGNPDYWWTLGDATFSISSKNLLNDVQKRSMHLNLAKEGDGVRNIGYWGINVVKGQTYQASFWLRTADGWTGDVTLTLESYEGDDLGHTVVHVEDAEAWRKYTAEITATGDDRQGWFALRGSHAGTLYLDCVSLFPPTFKDRPNGMRRDLAEKLADLHPRFMRFPGGCYVEGGKRFQWRHTVGPVEERFGIYNSHWGYPVTNGMGFHEFLQLAEDLGAEPLFVCNVGLGHGWYQACDHLQGYIQEALDALEYANGDISTFWGAKRAAAGHPEPFNLRLMEIGNENYNYHADDNSDQSDHYAERFRQFSDAIKARWPEVVCIGNVESWSTDNPTWRNRYAVDIVDEHYYRSPDWFAANYHKYDNASRSSNKIYNGEYAVTSDFGTNGTLKAALGEAIYMAGMERNSDVCVMASYAPIFMNENEAQWRPDMLHCNAHASFGTPSYWAQQMMASTVGYQNITWTETDNDVSLTTNARLGLGSWNTDVTYSNIRVTDANGNVADGLPTEDIHSPASAQGTTTVLDVCTDDCTIELDAVKNSGSEGFLVTFAYADGSNYTWWNLGGWVNARHGVEQAINGSKSTLATANGSIETGRTYHLKIVRSGDTASCYLDDELIHEVQLRSSGAQRLFLCASLNEAEDTAIVKVINYGAQVQPARFCFPDATVQGPVRLRVMSHTDNYAENSMDRPLNVCPQERTLTELSYDVPAYSLSVLQIPLAQVSEEVKPQPDPDLPEPVVSYSFESGLPQDDSAALDAALQGGAGVLQLDDGNHALYTGGDDLGGYIDLGTEAAQAIGSVLNGEASSVSIDLLLHDGGHLNHYCWAWNVNNGTADYVGLINQANNLNWYFEKVNAGACKVSSHAGLSQRQWHNLTVTADADAVRIYVDGQLRGSEPPLTQPTTLRDGTQAWIGRSPFQAASCMTSTFFDALRVYDCALTPGQVLTLHQQATEKATECRALQPTTDDGPNAEAISLIADGEEVDITALIRNADFTDGSEGWEGTSFSAAPGTVAEHYFQIFDTYQVLRNMPAGRYRLEWQGFYRNGNIDNAWLRHTLGSERTAEVYANDVAVTMRSLYDADAPYSFSPYTYPDNVQTANAAFEEGNYRQQLDFQILQTQDIRIGLRHLAPAVYDWACVDNFRLFYIDNATALKTISDPRPTQAAYDIAGRKVADASATTNLPKGLYIVGGKKVIVK